MTRQLKHLEPVPVPKVNETVFALQSMQMYLGNSNLNNPSYLSKQPEVEFTVPKKAKVTKFKRTYQGLLSKQTKSKTALAKKT